MRVCQRGRLNRPSVESGAEARTQWLTRFAMGRFIKPGMGGEKSWVLPLG